MATRILQIMEGGRIPIDIGSIHEVELQDLLGSGGFASAWKVADCSTGQHYVLKIHQGILPGSVEAERVRREASVAIPSEHVVPVVGLCEWDPSTFLILFEYAPGTSLDILLEAGVLTADEKRHIFGQTLVGVADAHRHNIIHRDLKPANIIVGYDWHVQLIDFGISKFKGPGLTVSGAIMGTLPYIAPEIIVEGAKVADARVDIYSLGQILYELAMGQHFWTRMGWAELTDLVSFLTREPKPTEIINLTDFHCDFYPDAASVLRRMTKIDPNDRYSLIEDVMLDLGYIPNLPPAIKDLHLRSPLLIVESGTNRGARTVLGLSDGDRRAMGRHDFAGDELSISRRHFEISRAGDSYFVQDIGSTHGTMVRGLLLWAEHPPMELHHGDRIRIGDVYLRFAFLRDVS
jgi:serine/threonine-protein kinase